MSKHTPEPWYVEANFIVGVLGDIDTRVNVYDHDPGNRDRIVACVNACAGMADPASEIAALKAQRDELLAACKEANEWLVAMTLKAAFNQENKVAQDEASQIVREVSSHLSAAIANAEGGAA